MRRRLALCLLLLSALTTAGCADDSTIEGAQCTQHPFLYRSEEVVLLIE